jgi:uncharacterized protein (TIGR02996 family)
MGADALLQALERARDALEADALERALDALLDAWRACRDERIAAAIDKLSAQLAAMRGEGRSTRVVDRQASWIALADRGEAADVGNLLATLDDVGDPALVRARVARLALRPADPRIAAGLVAFARRQLSWGGERKVTLAALDVAVAVEDPRQARELEHTRIPVWDPLIDSRERDEILAAFRRATAIDLGAAERELVDEIDAHVDRPRAMHVVRDRRGELFAAVYAHPDDDSPRAVLADYLQERGDPRGEFIALQLARPRDAPPSRRETDLLRRGRREWLGAIAPLVVDSRPAYERGFVARCSIRHDGSRLHDHLCERPEWATIVEANVHETRGREAILVERMPALRVLRGTVAAVLHAHPTLAEVQASAATADQIAALAARDLPALRSLRFQHCRCTPAELQPLWDSPIGRRLRRFEADLLDVVAHLPILLRLTIDELVLGEVVSSWKIHVAGSTVRIALADGHAIDYLRLLAAIRGLAAPRVRSVSIDDHGAQLPAEITAALARFG